MTGRDIVKAIMTKVGVTNATLAGRIGIAPNVMWDRINNKRVKDIPLSSLDELVRALDYKIMIVPMRTKCPEDGFVIEQPRRVKKSENTKKEEV